MKMKKQLAVALSTFGVAALALGGSTFAWFQVANTANLGLNGTTVAVGDNLQVGFKFADPLAAGEITTAQGLGLVKDIGTTGVTGEVWWAPNNISPAIMEFVTEVEGYAVDSVIAPVTSGFFEEGTDEIALKEKPVFDANRTDRTVEITTAADKDTYIGFDMVFRVSTANVDINQSELDEPQEGYKLYFDSNTNVIGYNNVAKGFRLGMKNVEEDNNVIIAPAKVASGATDVGGRMDLNGDGVYDFTAGVPVLGSDASEEITNPTYEIAYGEFDPALANATNWAGTISGSGVYATPFTNNLFYQAVSHNDAFPLINATAKTAEYDVVSRFQAGVGTPEALGTTDVNGLIEFQFLFWLEGWDHATVNSVSETAFALYLSFVAIK